MKNRVAVYRLFTFLYLFAPLFKSLTIATYEQFLLAHLTCMHVCVRMRMRVHASIGCRQRTRERNRTVVRSDKKFYAYGFIWASEVGLWGTDLY